MLDIPAYYYLIAVGIGVVVGLLRRDWLDGLLAAYLFFLLAETVLIRKPGTLRYELMLFRSWKDPVHHDQIMANIIMFIPVGMLIGRSR